MGCCTQNALKSKKITPETLILQGFPGLFFQLPPSINSKMGERSRQQVLCKSLIYDAEQFFWPVILYFRIDIHSGFAVFMSGEILNCLGIDTCVKKIGDVGMPKLVWGHGKIHGVNNPGIVGLMSSQCRAYLVFDPLSIDCLIASSFLSRANYHMLPYCVKL